MRLFADSSVTFTARESRVGIREVESRSAALIGVSAG